MQAYSGARLLQPGLPNSVVYNFSVSVTPVKGDYQHTQQGKVEHYVNTRHFHVPYGQWNPPTAASLKKDLGVTVQILHQSNKYNPYIDWPFHPSVVPNLKSFVNDAKAAGVRIKLYYTVGQLTNHAVELFAFAGLNGEVLSRNPADQPPAPGPGVGGMGGNLTGNEWLEEHMVRNYEGGWFTQNPGGDEDAAIADDVTSRYCMMHSPIDVEVFRLLQWRKPTDNNVVLLSQDTHIVLPLWYYIVLYSAVYSTISRVIALSRYGVLICENVSTWSLCGALLLSMCNGAAPIVYWLAVLRLVYPLLHVLSGPSRVRLRSLSGNSPVTLRTLR